MKNKFPKYISNEIKKTENKYNIKQLLTNLKNLDRKIIIKDELQFEIKPVPFDYVPDKADVVDFFHEKEANKNDFFKNNISDSLKDNLYFKHMSNNPKESKEKENMNNNLINELLDKIETEENEKNNQKLKNTDNLGNNFDFYKYYKIHREKAEKLKKSLSSQNIFQKNYKTISPNYDYIRKRIITAPKWRNASNKKKSNNEQTTSFISNYNNIIHLFNNESILTKSYKTQNDFGKFINKNRNKKNNISNVSKISVPITEKQIKNKNINLNNNKIHNLSKEKKIFKLKNKSKTYFLMNKSQENINNIKKIN